VYVRDGSSVRSRPFPETPHDVKIAGHVLKRRVRMDEVVRGACCQIIDERLGGFFMEDSIVCGKGRPCWSPHDVDTRVRRKSGQCFALEFRNFSGDGGAVMAGVGGAASGGLGS